MAISLRTLDDGAWISVDDSREVSVSDVWALAGGDFCACETAHVLLEGFYDAGIAGPHVVAGAVGQCIDCGERDSIDRLPVGRVVDGRFRPYGAGGVQWHLGADRRVRSTRRGQKRPERGRRGED